MVQLAVLSTIEGNQYRVMVNGTVSLPMLKLEQVGALQLGDRVLCCFDSTASLGGVIIGRVIDG